MLCGFFVYSEDGIPGPIHISPKTKDTSYIIDLSTLKSKNSLDKSELDIPHLYANHRSYFTSDGSFNAGGIYSYGFNDVPDRFIGLQTSKNAKTVIFGFALAVKDAYEALVSFNYGQWRFGQNISDTVISIRVADMALDAYESGLWRNGIYDDSLFRTIGSLKCIICSNGNEGSQINGTKIVKLKRIALNITDEVKVVLFSARTHEGLSHGIGFKDIKVEVDSTKQSNQLLWLQILIPSVLFVSVLCIVISALVYIKMKCTTRKARLIEEHSTRYTSL